MSRAWRWLWLLVFLLPLTLVAGRFCWFGPVDIAYHGLVTLHEVLPQLFAVAAILSIITVIVRVTRVQDRLNILSALSSDPPVPLRAAFTAEAERLRMSPPQIVYVSAAAPLCFTGYRIRRTAVFISRGFLADLSDTEMRLVAHHELVHIRDSHPAWNFFWHVLFAALVIPGFTGLERLLRQRRELRANMSAARIDPSSYEHLLIWRAQKHKSLCFDAQPEPQRNSRFGVAAAPAAVLSFFVALGIAHADFMHDLPYLVTHHC